MNGADGRTRTGDLTLTKRLLYQLSYIGTWLGHCNGLALDNGLTAGGFRTKQRLRAQFSEVETQVQTKGTLTVICGPMFSGKSRELIRTVEIAEIAGQPVTLLKAGIDLRDIAHDVASHAQQPMKARALKTAKEIILIVKSDTPSPT